MTKLNTIVVCVFLSIQGILFSQEIALKNADKSFENLAYKDAIKQYTDIIKKGSATIEIYQKLGDAYYFNADFDDAAKWYERMLVKREEYKKDSIKLQQIAPEYYFKTALCFKFLEKYEEADSLMFKLEQLNVNDSRVKRLIKNPNYREDITFQSGRYVIKNLSKNSAYTDFAPSFYKDKLVFSSARKNKKKVKKINQWTNQPYLNLFSYSPSDTTRFSFPRKFSVNLNSRLHESTSTFHGDGTLVYFTRNNFVDFKLKKDSIGISRLKILKASLNEELKWSSVVDLPFNNDQYSTAHPSLSYDGKKLYFVSDMPGGYGMSDIYVVDVLDDGTFGEPKNLGPDINTEGRDTFPFIAENGELYFASDGHLGLGGFDVFVINLKNEEKKVYNIGAPINSSSDDITFIIDSDSRKGYFASNRSGGRGDDDIYSFIENTPLITKCKGSIRGLVLDEASGGLLFNSDIQIRNENNEVIFSGVTDDKASFYAEVDCNNKAYEVIVKKRKYDSIVKKITITREVSKIVDTLKLKSNVPSKGVDLAKLLKLKPMYFASNSVVILGDTAKELDKIVEYMKKNKTINIEVGSHTDSKGSDSYNMKLSKKRAVSTVNYIISNKIDASRVKSKGYGETVLINECKNRVKCSKEEHALNRRSEFIVIDN